MASLHFWPKKDLNKVTAYLAVEECENNFKSREREQIRGRATQECCKKKPNQNPFLHSLNHSKTNSWTSFNTNNFSRMSCLEPELIEQFKSFMVVILAENKLTASWRPAMPRSSRCNEAKTFGKLFKRLEKSKNILVSIRVKDFGGASKTPTFSDRYILYLLSRLTLAEEKSSDEQPKWSSSELVWSKPLEDSDESLLLLESGKCFLDRFLADFLVAILEMADSLANNFLSLDSSWSLKFF